MTSMRATLKKRIEEFATIPHPSFSHLHCLILSASNLFHPLCFALLRANDENQHIYFQSVPAFDSAGMPTQAFIAKANTYEAPAPAFLEIQ